MLFIDTSNIDEIRKYISLNIVSGITTNQKILLQDKQTNIEKTIQNLIEVSNGLPINIELTKTHGTDQDLITEAIEYSDMAENIVIKIPMWGDGRGLRIAKCLRKNGIPVNITCCITPEQVILASLSGAEYVSLFFRRIFDYYFCYLNSQTKAQTIACNVILYSSDFLIKSASQTQLIIGSIREPDDVSTALFNGADIVTVPPKILEQMFKHPKTDETIQEFDLAWEKLSGGGK